MKHSRSFHVGWLLAAAVLLASCAGVRTLPQQDAAQHARFNAYAGAPVNEFMWVASHRGRSAIWTNQVVAWANINRPYLLTVAQPCPNLMLANGIRITSTMNTVRARTDYVIARGRHCEIQKIQPVHYLRMQRDLRQKRQAAAG
ncbi:MAG: DUF6491 family protein [Steroidobacteraceae bacterium]